MNRISMLMRYIRFVQNAIEFLDFSRETKRHDHVSCQEVTESTVWIDCRGRRKATTICFMHE